jgi:beta-lactamase class A
MRVFVIMALMFCNSISGTTSGMDRNRKSLKKAGDAIDSVIAATPGTFAIAFLDLRTGKALYRNATMEFHAASTMKTAVMVEVFRQVRARKFSLTDSLLLKNSFRSIVDGSPFSLESSSDSDDSLYARLGQKVPMRKLVHEMITVSSNLATNLLIEKVSAHNVATTMKTLGVPHIKVLRGVEDAKAFDAGLNNSTTARDMMRLMELIARGQAVSKSASKAMTDILLDQRFNERIPASLPPSAKVAHKTGSITGIQHDAGFVILPDGRRYVLVVLSKELKDAEAGKESIAAISKILYDYEVE